MALEHEVSRPHPILETLRLTRPSFPPVCIGLHLARFEIALGAITFFKAYPTARVAPQMTEADMEFENFFLIAPKGHKCLVVF